MINHISINRFAEKAEKKQKRKEYSAVCQLGKRSRKVGLIIKDLGVEPKAVQDEIISGGIKLLDI